MTAQNIDGRVSWPPYDEIDGETQLVCPVCGTHNNDNWPVEVNGKIKRGGCQDCWERQCDAAWWKMVVAIDTLQGNDSESL
jgi:hypothetical protein